MRVRPRHWQSTLQRTAVILLVLAVGHRDWSARLPPMQDFTGRAVEVLGQQALMSHSTYTGGPSHALEIATKAPGGLKAWLSLQLGRDVNPPDLSALGYEMVDERLLPTGQKYPAVVLTYNDAKGVSLSVIIRSMTEDLHVSKFDIDRGPLNGCGWIEKGLGYALVAEMPDSDLDRIVGLVRGPG
jgi:anti-sigma factor RsiW